MATLCLLVVTARAGAEADSGVFGRAAWRGELVPGVVVTAHREGPGDLASREVARSAKTAVDGTYRLPLPPGRYVMVARSGGSGPARPGEHFCYYSGSPVVVGEGAWTPVGFNLVKVPEERRRPAERSAIEGTVTYRGNPLERLYLYIYEDDDDGFRGPGLATLPVGAGGTFRAVVQPGLYYLIARKRAKGGLYGPMEIGDHFNYYPGNPVRVEEGQAVQVDIETVTRISQLEEGESPFPTVRGAVLDDGGRPVPDVRVLAYRPGDTKGRPLFFSEAPGADGRFALPIPEPGPYVLVARERFGGPASPGEYFGESDPGRPVEVASGRPAPGPLTITVRRQP